MSTIAISDVIRDSQGTIITNQIIDVLVVMDPHNTPAGNHNVQSDQEGYWEFSYPAVLPVLAIMFLKNKVDGKLTTGAKYYPEIPNE